MDAAETFIADLSSLEPGSPSGVVLRFLQALVEADVEVATALIDDDLVYENVSLPTIRGKRAFVEGAERFNRLGLGFEVAVHRVTENGPSVMTERTDVLTWRRFRTQFWVTGVFEVHDGAVTLWRDYFDFWNITVASLRGLVGMVVPSLQARLSSSVEAGRPSGAKPGLG